MDRLPVRFDRTPDLSRRLRRLDHVIVSRNLFRDGQKILIAVSGGLDSMVLLHALHHLAGAHRWQLVVAHYNHQLRGPESDADEQLVLTTARRLGCTAVSGRGDVGQAARARGISSEMAGRKLRHAFLARTARKHGIETIALAHHADDQVELFFVRLLRGTGARALAGMQWSNPSPSDPRITLARPLLDQSKETLLETAQGAGVLFSEDATNTSHDIYRNRVRHELLPLLRKHYQPRLSERILRLMDLTGAEADVSTDMAQKWLASKKRSAFARLPVAVQRQVIYSQLARMGHAPDFALVDHLRLHADEPVSVGSKQTVSRDPSGLLRADKTEPQRFDAARVELSLAKRKGKAPFAHLELEWQILNEPGDKFVKEPATEYFDAGKIGRPICLRHWRPGDRFQPIGMKSPQKLQDLFVNLKVPRAHRRRLVVAAGQTGELFWVEGLRIGESFKLRPTTRRRLKLQWHALRGVGSRAIA